MCTRRDRFILAENDFISSHIWLHAHALLTRMLWAAGDRSRAGGVDAPIRDLVATLNRHADLFTTSSCSGRVSVFGAPTAATRARKKKGGAWAFVTHGLADTGEVIAAVEQHAAAGASMVCAFIVNGGALERTV